MAQYEHGSMDITEKEKTFEGFIKFSSRTAIICILLLVFIALVNG